MAENKKNLTVIFDFDGTVTEILGYGLDIVNQLADEFGFRKVRREEIEKLRDLKVRELAKEFGIPLIKIPMVAKRAHALVKEDMEKLAPAPGMKAALGKLHLKGYGLGILTSNSKENVEEFLKNNNLEFFDFVYSSSSIFGKAGKMKKLMRNHNLSPENVVYVGDEIRDIDAAKKSGVRIISVGWGFNSEKSLRAQNPDFVVSKPEELVVVLENMR